MTFLGKYSGNLLELRKSAEVELKGENVSLGSTMVGNATLQCNFLESISEWGTLGEQKVGLLYFNMTAVQNNDTKLKWAEFDVVFQRYAQGNRSPAVLENFLEPSALPGKVITEHTEKLGKLAPKLNITTPAGGGGVELGEKQKKKSVDKNYYWLVGGTGRAEGDSSRINRAVWEWQANKKAPQALSKTFRGGVVVISIIEGDFNIQLRLRGRLKSRWQRFGTRFGFKKTSVQPKLREVHSKIVDKNLEIKVRHLKEEIHRNNQDEQDIA